MAVSTFKYFLLKEAKPSTQQKKNRPPGGMPGQNHCKPKELLQEHLLHVGQPLYFMESPLFEDYFYFSFRAFSTQLSPL